MLYINHDRYPISSTISILFLLQLLQNTCFYPRKYRSRITKIKNTINEKKSYQKRLDKNERIRSTNFEKV